MNNIKFSIIVPVYNVEKYLKKCINSILNQTYKNYEIIIINDGSTDKSKKILESYKNIDNVKIINQTNKGLSVARNIGIKNATGDYLLFVDSDDYIDNDLLENLNKNITDEEIIRFQTRTVDESYKVLKEYNEMPFDTMTGNEALVYILNYHFIENTWLYCYNKIYIEKNNFKFDQGFIHEDFGLTPLILANTKSIKSINYIGYNYLIRNNSLSNSKDINKVKKKCNDFIELGLRNINIIKKLDISNKELLLSYIANSILIKGKELDKLSRKEYLKQIKENNINEYLLNNTIKRKIKRLIFKVNYNLYLMVV